MSHQKKFMGSLIPFLLIQFCASASTITPNKPINDGDVLVSEGETFALGFFSPGKSSNRYVGIWYNKVSEHTVVWVANRDNPINDTSGVLSIDTAGNLMIHGPDRNIPVWSTNFSAPAVASTYSAQLLDSGNLVVFEGDNNSFIAWQSFDYPTNTLLPYMKLGVNRTTGLNWFPTSWKSADDPGTGEYSYKWDFTGSPPELVLFKSSAGWWRAGPWNGLRWSGVADMIPRSMLNVSFIDNQEEISLSYTMVDPSIFSRLVVNESGNVERLTWRERDRGWVGFWSVPNDQCDYYGRCGPYGNCDPSNATDFDCKCLPGFNPKSERDWNLRDGTGGCVRKRGMSMCRNGEGFIKVDRAKVPDTSIAVLHRNVGLQECEKECLSNCSCTGYASSDITKLEGIGSGCITWHGELMDTREFANSGQDFYIRADAVEFAQYLKSQQAHGKKSMAPVIAASVATASLVLIISLLCWWVMRKRKGKRGQHNWLFSSNTTPTSFGTSSGQQFDERGTNADLPLFDLSTIAVATDNFSDANKLGQGGFGTVYQGRLDTGQEIAVKRLAKNSGQGVEEFKNEVTLIAKLQHRNLVRLLGCCIRQEEKMLIYEYLPNKGLDSFIFDKTKGSLLDWRMRFDIVLGIARGMLYLHQDSRLRIIHRDLKASNVLLDAAMNPKISDFGLARNFGGDQIEGSTNRVVGTYGYMSPEYAMEGQFSVKSDVFSFGVLLLEIISGRKNSSYFQENAVNLIGQVWYLWREDKSLDIVDSLLGESYPAQEVLRCIHIGLLCVQEFAMDRPTMSDVAFMLCHETALPSPKQPAFILARKKGPESSSSASAGTSTSINDITLSVIEAR